MRCTWQELQALTGGRWETPPPVDPPGVTAVLDDTRCVSGGELYVAIPGVHVDGHDFVHAAVQAGAAAVCIHEDRLPALRKTGAPWPVHVPRLLVPNPLLAFHRLARAHRNQFPDLKMIAVTGSSGKTSVRTMIAAILQQQWPQHVIATKGNTNNHFGVPRNVLQIDTQHVAAVLELGSNHPGEIAQLTRIVGPDIGVITNIGHAHLEFFHSLNGVACEKGALLTGLNTDGIAIIPAAGPEHAVLRRLAAGADRVITFGTEPHADVRVTYGGRSAGGFQISLHWPGRSPDHTLEWHIGGRHQAVNAAAAAAVGWALDIPASAILDGLAATELPGMRMQVEERQGVTWVNDAYNANPDSARAGARWFGELCAELPPERCFLVLGDMLELGHAAATEHASLLAWVKTEFPDFKLVAVGPNMSAAAATLEIPTFSDATAARLWLWRHLQPGDHVLLKGSRGVRLECLLEEP